MVLNTGPHEVKKNKNPQITQDQNNQSVSRFDESIRERCFQCHSYIKIPPIPALEPNYNICNTFPLYSIYTKYEFKVLY